ELLAARSIVRFKEPLHLIDDLFQIRTVNSCPRYSRRQVDQSLDRNIAPRVPSYLVRLRPPFRPPLRLADLPALEILAARVLDMPLRLSASYFALFLIEFPAMGRVP